jgi:hypothetical protein
MALVAGVHLQSILVGYEPSGSGWVSWVVLAVIVSVIAVSFLGIVRGLLRNGIIKWRFHQISRRADGGPETEQGDP